MVPDEEKLKGTKVDDQKPLIEEKQKTQWPKEKYNRLFQKRAVCTNFDIYDFILTVIVNE